MINVSDIILVEKKQVSIDIIGRVLAKIWSREWVSHCCLCVHLVPA